MAAHRISNGVSPWIDLIGALHLLVLRVLKILLLQTPQFTLVATVIIQRYRVRVDLDCSLMGILHQ